MEEALWYPFAQHYEKSFYPVITRGEGVYLFTQAGEPILDLISSWWVNLHGHSHPYMVAALQKQIATLDHVLLAELCHDKALAFSNALVSYAGEPFRKVFFSDNGSTAVEVALKMSFSILS